MKFNPQNHPLIPILRGIQTEEAIGIAQALVEQGYECVEVPLNSPNPFATLKLLRQAFPKLVLGAGTVLRVEQVDELASLGVDLILAPNCNPRLIEKALALGLQIMPGVATPSECFAAIDVGTDLLKAFPGEMISPKVVKAWKAVLPAQVRLFPVGGINAQNMASYVEAGADGFGFGSALYAPSDSAERVSNKAYALRQAWDAAHGRFQA
jgi:2-dehydro-3-deoxyphosphogalactonate aldolase